MATIIKGNWSFRDPGDAIPDGSTIENGNFVQVVPDTEILAGKVLVINGGNWCNVRKDPNWTINGGNWTKANRCSHLHPNMVARGVLPECPENCPHVVDVDVIEGEGGQSVTIYHYEDTRIRLR